MAGRCCFTSGLLLSFAALLQVSESSLRKVELQTRGPTGIFMLLDGEKYTLNFTAARAACLFLNVTIATRAQMEHAVQQGLETCKFGWTEEQMAVIPRIQSNEKCGKGRTGVVTWQISADRKFGVFCFNASALSDQDVTLTSSTPPTSLTALTWTSSPLRPLVRSTTSAKRPTKTKPTTETPSASDLALLVNTTPSARRSSSSSVPETLVSQSPGSARHLMTSKLTAVSSAFLTSPQTTSSSVSSEPGLLQTVSSADPSPGAAPAGLISLGLVLLLLTAAGLGWFCTARRNAPLWYQRHQKDVTDTEMWTNTYTDSELRCEPEAETDHDEERATESRDVALRGNPEELKCV